MKLRDKSLARLIKKKLEHPDKMHQTKREVTTGITEIQRIVRDCYVQLYSNRLEILEEMDKFLETYNLHRLNHEGIENLNRLITSEVTESVIKNLPTNKRPRPDRFIAEFYQTFKEEVIPIFLKLFHKIEEEETLPNSPYEVSFTLISKQSKTP